jgi:hypothetical protein
VLAFLAMLAVRADASPSPVATTSGLTSAPDLDGDTADGEPGVGVIDASADGTTTSAAPPEALVDPAIAAATARTAPSVRVAIEAAYRVAGLAADPAPGFARRSRLAALVPWVGVQVGKDDTWSEVIDPTIGHMFVYDVRATWHFDRLVFDANEMRASQMELARRRDRRRLSLIVSRIYFMWLRASAAAERVPGWAVRAEQAAAELEALTEGAWTVSASQSKK